MSFLALEGSPLQLALQLWWFLTGGPVLKVGLSPVWCLLEARHCNRVLLEQAFSGCETGLCIRSLLLLQPVHVLFLLSHGLASPREEPCCWEGAPRAHAPAF